MMFFRVIWSKVKISKNVLFYGIRLMIDVMLLIFADFVSF